jgi:hypothetical protein
VFTVLKKSGKLRLVVDARMSNCWFDDPEAVDLATVMAFSTIELDSAEPVVFGQVDIANAFYAIELPSELRRFFGLPSVLAKEVGIKELDGKPIGPKTRIVPCLSVVPMGWTQALVVCQRILEEAADTAGFDPNARLVDRKPCPHHTSPST